MKDQVVMSKTNGQLAIAVPLFRMVKSDLIESLAGFNIMLTRTKPIAYALDCGDEVGISLVNADFVDKNAEFLGDL